MAITNQNIDVRRGDTQLVFIDLDNADGTAFDPTITGVAMEWRMATSPDGTTLARKTLDDGGITVAAGGVNLELTSADTDHVPRLYYHELKVFDGDDVATVMLGTFVVRRALRMGEVSEPTSASLSFSSDAPTIA